MIGVGPIDCHLNKFTLIRSVSRAKLLIYIEYAYKHGHMMQRLVYLHVSYNSDQSYSSKSGIYDVRLHAHEHEFSNYGKGLPNHADCIMFTDTCRCWPQKYSTTYSMTRTTTRINLI